MRQFLLEMERRYTSMHSRDQRIFPYFVFICIFLVGYFVLVSPLSRKTDFLAADNRQLEQEVYSLDQKLTILQDVQKRKVGQEERQVQLKEQFEKLRRRVPAKDEIAGILAHLAAAEQVEFLIRDIAEKDYIEDKKFTVIPLLVNARADYDHIHSFLKRIESSPRLLTIESLDMGIDPDNPTAITASFTVQAYKIRSLETLLAIYRNRQQQEKKEKTK